MSRRQRPPAGRRHAIAPVYTITIGLALLVTAGLTLLLVWRLGLSVLVGYLLAVNATTLLAYAYDKGVSGGERQRVPERVLHGLALFGGTPGALAGQLLLRHKTRKTSFRAWFWTILVVQVAAVSGWIGFHSR